MVEAPILSMESFPSKQSIKPLICLLKYFLSHRHKSRQHHIPNNHPKEGEGVIKIYVELDMFTNKFILQFCAISIVSAGKCGVRF